MRNLLQLFLWLTKYQTIKGMLLILQYNRLHSLRQDNRLSHQSDQLHSPQSDQLHNPLLDKHRNLQSDSRLRLRQFNLKQKNK